MLINTLPYDCASQVTLPAEWGGKEVLDEWNKPLGSQLEVDGTVTACGKIPATGMVNWKRGKNQAPHVSTSTPNLLENALIRYEFNPSGELIRAFDKTAGRELLAPGMRGNVLTAYVDRPNNYDAWDVDVFYPMENQFSASQVNVSPVIAGTVTASLERSGIILNSKFNQRIVLGRNSKRLDFITNVNCQEEHKMLRVAFEVKLFSDCANFEIQYGHVSRALHSNTSWDMAKFEVPGHRYMDISELQYGVALLNDCKYGYRADKRGLLDLCLLRSPLYPDPLADRGAQTMTFAFLPHFGNLVNSNVMAEAAMLKRTPVIAVGRKGIFSPPFHLNPDLGVTLEVLKKAEKSPHLILRLFETNGQPAQTTLFSSFPNARLEETNLLEWTSEGVFDFQSGKLELNFKPFEIRTFKVIIH